MSIIVMMSTTFLSLRLEARVDVDAKNPTLNKGKGPWVYINSFSFPLARCLLREKPWDQQSSKQQYLANFFYLLYENWDNINNLYCIIDLVLYLASILADWMGCVVIHRIGSADTSFSVNFRFSRCHLYASAVITPKSASCISCVVINSRKYWGSHSRCDDWCVYCTEQH